MEEVTVGETISLDAGNSQRGDTAISAYSWDFGDDTTTTGESVNHSYAEPGTYTVELTVEDFFGETASATTEVTVTTAATATPTPSSTARPTDNAETTSTGSPGFGVGITLTALGSSAYILAQRLSGE